MQESSFQGVLDAHYQVDRATYNELRKYEKDTGKALYQLKTDDAIQNYRIVEKWNDPLAASPKDRETFKAAQAAARDSYAEDVLLYVQQYQEEPWAVLVSYCLPKLKEAHRDFLAIDKLIKDIKDQEKAIAMVLAQISDVSLGAQIKTRRLSCLFGEAPVYLSAQFHWECNQDWRKAASEKTGELAALLPALKNLKQGRLNGVSFGKRMRLPGLRRAVLALADNEQDYVRYQGLLKELDDLHDEYKNRAGEQRRTAINREFFVVAMAFLKTIGVDFEKLEGDDGRKRFDPAQPIVPDWDFDSMEKVLLLKAESLKHLPVKPIDEVVEDLKWPGGWVSNELCQTCVHCGPTLICAWGKPIQPDWEGYAAETEDCETFKKRPERLN